MARAFRSKIDGKEYFSYNLIEITKQKRLILLRSIDNITEIQVSLQSLQDDFIPFDYNWPSPALPWKVTYEFSEQNELEIRDNNGHLIATLDDDKEILANLIVDCINRS